MDIQTVTILGANGTLGVGAGGIFASFGNANVYMVARTKEKADKAIQKACQSVRANAIKENMIPKTYEEIKECIQSSNFVIECVSEDYNIKKEIHAKINDALLPNTVTATVSSGLSINELAKCYDPEKRKRFLGVHFFNPPYNLSLCEIIPNQDTDVKIMEFIKEYLENRLFRKVVIVKDEPAFLANRIGFRFINEAMQFAEKYRENGGIDYIDTLLGKFTGRNISPLQTADFVGLDVHKAIVDNIYQKITNGKEEYKMPFYVEDLIKQQKLGDKMKIGLYQKEEDMVYDIKEKKYRKKKQYSFPTIEKVTQFFREGRYQEGIEELLNNNTLENKIITYFLLTYVLSSIAFSKQIASKVTDCDIAMAEGFNWIPPYALVEAIGGKKCFLEKCQKYLETEVLEKYDVNELLKEEIVSEYDYRKFLKADI